MPLVRAILKKGGRCLIALLTVQPVMAQRMLSEGTLQYTIAALPEAGNEVHAKAFDGASQVVSFRANLCRVDFISSLRKQSTFLNLSTGEATIIRETDDQKYQWNLNPAQWNTFISNNSTRNWWVEPKTSEVNGYVCQSAKALTKDGDSIMVYFTRQYNPMIKSYDPLTAGLDGIPVLYEIKSQKLTVRFTLISLQNQPVMTSRFQIPASGYKIIPFPEKNNNL